MDRMAMLVMLGAPGTLVTPFALVVPDAPMQ
jgi:hypothetical protein